MSSSSTCDDSTIASTLASSSSPTDSKPALLSASSSAWSANTSSISWSDSSTLVASPSSIKNGASFWPRYVPEKRCEDGWDINCTFEFEDGAYFYLLPYSVYRKWINIENLLRAMQNDIGILDIRIWDTREDMEVMAGDWEARVRPGWEIVVMCEECHNYEASEHEDEDDGEEWWDVEKGIRTRKTDWWFMRWRKRAERRKLGFKEGKRGWMAGLVGLLAMAMGSLVVFVLVEK